MPWGRRSVDAQNSRARSSDSHVLMPRCPDPRRSQVSARPAGEQGPSPRRSPAPLQPQNKPREVSAFLRTRERTDPKKGHGGGRGGPAAAMCGRGAFLASKGTFRQRAPGQPFAGAMGTQGLRSKVRCACTALHPCGCFRRVLCGRVGVPAPGQVDGGRTAGGGRTREEGAEGAAPSRPRGRQKTKRALPQAGPRAGGCTPASPRRSCWPLRPQTWSWAARGGDRPWVTVWHTNFQASTEQRCSQIRLFGQHFGYFQCGQLRLRTNTNLLRIQR